MATASNSRVLRIIPLLVAACVVLSGFKEFQSIIQPGTVLPGEAFTVLVETETTRPRGWDSEDDVNSIPYFGICLPQGWTIPNDKVICTGAYEVPIRYDAGLALDQEAVSPAPPGYAWWVGRGDVEDEGQGPVLIDIRIQTDEQVGLFSLDYMLGNSRDGVNQRRSNDHEIEVLADARGPGGLLAMVEGEAVHLSWDAPYNTEGLVGYVVYRDEEVISTSFIVRASYVDDAPPDGLHRYRVAAFYSDGDVYFSAEVELDVFLNAGGTGTRLDPFLIATASHLTAMGQHPNLWDCHFRLVNDIDLDPNLPGQQSFVGAVIARDIRDTQDGFQGTAFTGVFDGDNHSIRNLTMVGNSYLGLFGALGPEAQVTDLNMIDVDVMGYGRSVGSIAGYNAGTVQHCSSSGLLVGDSEIGGLVGFSDNATIIGCRSDADVLGSESIGGLVGLHSADDPSTGAIRDSSATGSVLGWDGVGGLVGANFSDVFNCESTGFISGDRYVGGLIGGHYQATVRDCNSSARVSGGWYIGGLIGASMSNVAKCFSTGLISGDAYVGGVIGYNDTGALGNSYSRSGVQGGDIVGGLVGANTGSIQFTYCSGPVSGENEVGGLVGKGDAQEGVHASFWDVEVSGQSASAGGIGLTTAELQDPSRYVDAGWDFAGESENGTENIWYLISEGYAAFFSFAGSGTQANPYLIGTVWHLTSIGSDPNMLDKHFRLTGHIDLDPNQLGGRVFSGAVIAPDVNPSNDSYDGVPFSGVFDGCGYEIHNMRIRGYDYLGLFGRLDSAAHVSNLSVVNGSIEVQDPSVLDLLRAPYQGLLAGFNDGDVEMCHTRGSISGRGRFTGGLIGENYGNVSHCTCAVDVNVSLYLGGLVGRNREGQIVDCHSIGTIDGSAAGGLVGVNYAYVGRCYATGDVRGGYKLGGLVGENRDSVDKCYSTGSATGSDEVGGLVGHNGGRGTISECYSIGAVTGDDDVGGLVGWNNWSVTNSFWNTETSGQSSSAGGFGMSTVQMQDVDTYLNAGWDFFALNVNGNEDIWVMEVYPVHYMSQLPGNGTLESPYLISAENKLIALKNVVPSGHYRLTEDIDLSGMQWSGPVFPDFSGTFDGNGFAIRNLTIMGEDYLGLFRTLGRNATIQNLTIEDVIVEGSAKRIGGLVGRNYGLVTNCKSAATVTGDELVGGLVGDNSYGSISNCHSTAVVTGNSEVGGVVGENGPVSGWAGRDGGVIGCDSNATVNGSIQVGGIVGWNDGNLADCNSIATVSGDNIVGGLAGLNYGIINDSFGGGNVNSGGLGPVGGLVGRNARYRIRYKYGPDDYSPGAISRCSSAGQVSGRTVGGLVGHNDGSGSISDSYSAAVVSGNSAGGLVGSNTEANISRCYSIGRVDGDNISGGLVGWSRDGSTASSFWNVETSGQTESSGGAGLTTAEMQAASTFLEAGWDFVDETENGTEDIWWILEGQDYPRLWWERGDEAPL